MQNNRFIFISSYQPPEVNILLAKPSAMGYQRPLASDVTLESPEPIKPSHLNYLAVRCRGFKDAVDDGAAPIALGSQSPLKILNLFSGDRTNDMNVGS
jgi:hypothetical protein